MRLLMTCDHRILMLFRLACGQFVLSILLHLCEAQNMSKGGLLFQSLAGISKALQVWDGRARPFFWKVDTRQKRKWDIVVVHVQHDGGNTELSMISPKYRYIDLLKCPEHPKSLSFLCVINTWAAHTSPPPTRHNARREHSTP